MFQDRDIFHYELEGRPIHGDPLKLYRQLQEQTGGQLAQLVNRSKDSDEPSRFATQGVLIDAARVVFQASLLDPDTGQGVTDAQVWSILCQFIGRLDDLRKKPRTSPTSTEPSEDLSWRGVTTKPESDSYLTSPESVPNEPTK